MSNDSLVRLRSLYARPQGKFRPVFGRSRGIAPIKVWGAFLLLFIVLPLRGTRADFIYAWHEAPRPSGSGQLDPHGLAFTPVDRMLAEANSATAYLPDDTFTAITMSRSMPIRGEAGSFSAATPLRVSSTGAAGTLTNTGDQSSINPGDDGAWSAIMTAMSKMAVNPGAVYWTRNSSSVSEPSSLSLATMSAAVLGFTCWATRKPRDPAMTGTSAQAPVPPRERI